MALTIARALPKLLRRATLARGYGELRANGWKRSVLWLAERAAYELRDDPSLYRHWWSAHSAPAVPKSREPVSIVMPVGNAGAHASVAIRSLLDQTHRDWTLRIATTLPRASFPDDPRVTLGAEALAGHHLLSMDASCALEPDAIARLVAAASTGDVVYCDDDELIDGVRRRPFFKPGFSIDLERATSYISPVLLTSAAWRAKHPSAEIGVVRAHKDGARIVRVPEVLVHRLVPRGPTTLPESPAAPPSAMASIVIPTRDRVDLLARCVDSIYRHTKSEAFEVLVLDNRSREAATHQWLAEAPAKYPHLRAIPADYDFNWSRLNNHGAAEARGDVLVFLNNDTEALAPNWLDRLVVHAMRSDVGTVGALLLYPDETIQHAGIVVGIGGVADHVYAGCPDRGVDRHLFVSPYVPRNVLAVTGACVAISRRAFDALGPFDERFRICGDVEMGIRAHRRGLLNVYEPRARLLHHESATRPKMPLDEAELALLRPVIDDFVRHGDPFYHPHLSLRSRYPTFGS